jgi:hypothetical protein
VVDVGGVVPCASHRKIEKLAFKNRKKKEKSITAHG